MTVATKDPRRADLSRSDLRKYPREVADVLLEAVGMGVPYRVIDGSHMRLYNGDRDVLPFKISASREARYTLQYLHRWLEANWKPWAEAKSEEEEEKPVDESVSDESLQALADRFNGESASEPEEEPVEEEPVEETSEPATEEDWQPYVSPSGIDHGFVTNGRVYRCTAEGCDYEQDYAQGLNLHAAMHNDKELWKRAVEGKNAACARRAEEQKVQQVREAAALLAKHHGLTVDDGEVERLRSEVESLREQVERLTKERDEAVTRLALVKEAFGA